jgi:NAD(P)-dependent dehydrogenase (short-subunit alcohol dehydrogenase family)
MELKLRGTAVMVTGGSQGIGLAIARGFAAEGARVAICARDRGRLDAAAAEIRAAGGECLPIAADLLDAEACRRVIDETAAAYGRLDVLVNNASTSVDRTPRSLEDATDAQLLERFMGKTMAAIRCSRAALPHMRRAGGGRIVCIGGTAARSVFRAGELPSMGSGLPQGLGNSALANFTKHLAEEVAGDRILVNIVHPHLTRTGRHPERVARRAQALGITPAEVEDAIAAQFPIGRIVEPGDIVPLVLLLASPVAGAITGQSITVDGGALRGIAY